MEYIKLVLIGTIIGLGAAAPGISGGSLAVATGIYDRAITALADFRHDMPQKLKFLLPLVIGGAIGEIGFIFGIKYLFEYFYAQTCFTFAGIMLGTFPSVEKRAERDGFRYTYIPVFIAALVITVLAFRCMGTGRALSHIDPSLGVVCGIIYSFGTIVPGVSSSFILMAMGAYTTLIDMITSGDIMGLVPVAAGAVCGVVIFLRLVKWLFEKAYGYASFAFFGLLAGSLIIIIPPISVLNFESAVSILLLIGGCVASFFLSKRLDG